MDRRYINQKLQEFSNRIDRIIGMFDENLTKRGAIAIEYARLKDDLKIEKDKFQTQQGWDHASEDERKFYSPAVEEAYIEPETGVKTMDLIFEPAPTGKI